MIDLETIVSFINESEDVQKSFNQPLESICAVSTLNVQLDINENLKVAFNLLGKAPRILATEDNQPIGIITHMDIVKFLVRKWDLFPKEMIEKLGMQMMTKNPILINLHENLGASLRRLATYHFGGTAVVNNQGEIVANLSITDVKGATPEDLKRYLTLSVETFLHETKKDLLKLTVVCTEDARLFDIAKLMQQNHIHRVHIVDKAKKPLGVLTTTDLMVELSKLTASE
jgi:CBS domain-containing protein